MALSLDRRRVASRRGSRQDTGPGPDRVGSAAPALALGFALACWISGFAAPSDRPSPPSAAHAAALVAEAGAGDEAARPSEAGEGTTAPREVSRRGASPGPGDAGRQRSARFPRWDGAPVPAPGGWAPWTPGAGRSRLPAGFLVDHALAPPHTA